MSVLAVIVVVGVVLAFWPRRERMVGIEPSPPWPRHEKEDGLL